MLSLKKNPVLIEILEKMLSNRSLSLKSLREEASRKSGKGVLDDFAYTMVRTGPFVYPLEVINQANLFAKYLHPTQPGNTWRNSDTYSRHFRQHSPEEILTTVINRISLDHTLCFEMRINTKIWINSCAMIYWKDVAELFVSQGDHLEAYLKEVKTVYLGGVNRAKKIFSEHPKKMLNIIANKTQALGELYANYPFLFNLETVHSMIDKYKIHEMKDIRGPLKEMLQYIKEKKYLEAFKYFITDRSEVLGLIWHRDYHYSISLYSEHPIFSQLFAEINKQKQLPELLNFLNGTHVSDFLSLFFNRIFDPDYEVYDKIKDYPVTSYLARIFISELANNETINLKDWKSVLVNSYQSFRKIKSLLASNDVNFLYLQCQRLLHQKEINKAMQTYLKILNKNTPMTMGCVDPSMRNKIWYNLFVSRDLKSISARIKKLTENTTLEQRITLFSDLLEIHAILDTCSEENNKAKIGPLKSQLFEVFHHYFQTWKGSNNTIAPLERKLFCLRFHPFPPKKSQRSHYGSHYALLSNNNNSRNNELVQTAKFE